tara:strand:+ start:483 stop:713 length:231 start_codon:yes stop_codon:yes gene_type:complete
LFHNFILLSQILPFCFFGELISQDNPGSDHNVDTTVIHISRTFGSRYQQGKIKLALIYNRALSESEIKQNKEYLPQ